MAGISLSPGAEMSLVGNVTALFLAAAGAGAGGGMAEPGSGRGIDDSFVYPPPMAMA